MKTVAKRLLSLALGLCLAVAGVFTIAPTVTASAAAGTWTLVTDANDLAVGDQVIIVAATANLAMSTTQNGNNRGNTAITKTGDTVTISSSVQVLTLKEGTSEGSFGLYAASGSTTGYLWAAGGTSTKNNYLRTSSTHNDKSSWTISITSKGIATIKVVDSTVVKNWMRYNSSSKIFSCYSTQQQDICLYKFKEIVDDTTPYLTISGDNYMQLGGEPINLTVDTNVEETISWTSSNEDVATVENGIITAVALGTTTITAIVGDLEAAQIINVHPSNAKELTIAEALEICKWTGTTATYYTYSTTGIIEKIDTPYSSQYKNISVTINDGKNSILLYRLKGGSELKVGDCITVTGHLINYKQDGVYTAEFNSGTTYVTAVPKLDYIKSYMQLAYKYTEDVVNEEVVLKDSDFRLKCGIDAITSEIADIESYGIRVTANGKTKDYTSENATSWTTASGVTYVVVSLGDIINDTAKLGTEFTVQAFVVIDGETVVCDNAKTYSVATMVAAYQQAGEEVEHLYNYLVEKGLIVVEEVA